MRVEVVEDTEGGDMVGIDSCPSEGCTDLGTSEHNFLQWLEAVSLNPNHRPKPFPPHVLFLNYAVYNGH